MADQSSPQALLGAAVAYERLLSVLLGVYLYEFLCSVRFDYILVTRNNTTRSLLARGVKALYMICRCSLLAACSGLILIDAGPGGLGCSLIIKLGYGTVISALLSATALLFVRVGVVWSWDRRLTYAFLSIYSVIFALAICAVILIEGRSSGNLFGPACNAVGGKFKVTPIVGNLVLDISLLLLLLDGLRRRWSAAGVFGLWYVLLTQGLVHLAIITVVEVPLTAFLYMNQDVLVMFDLPFTLMLPIGATRLYRALKGLFDKRQSSVNESAYTRPHPSRFQDAHAGASALSKQTSGGPPSDVYEMKVTLIKSTCQG